MASASHQLPGRASSVTSSLRLAADQGRAGVARLGAGEVGLEEHRGAHGLVAGLDDAPQENRVRGEDARPLAAAVDAPVKRVEGILAPGVHHLGPMTAEVALGLGDQASPQFARLGIVLENEDGDRPQRVVQMVRPPEQLLGPEPGMHEPHDPAVAFGHDQAGGIEVHFADDVGVEFVPAQGAGRRTRGECPVPECGQGRGITVAERAKVRHRCASSSSRTQEDGADLHGRAPLIEVRSGDSHQHIPALDLHLENRLFDP